ncbi:MAG: aminoacetone oxidase family FAD-binding enzyme [Methanobrevibacter sp.]|uniref:NAD(P)/FAD-dependent oxidoreductase n=1 Tax=Methanobrevibacter sp. TaxID=66852 RepID=UPI0026DFE2D3|nr:aminoacetone oxidase family FAD-binding enzyme [Methanobrevibacter sp.]MDO5847913.1 aminoacetone oxidase family FAD-binding enzyme [Methanobrevibacter sp.]
MKEYEIAIVGGGPAGMMAAIAAEGKDVVILEKNQELGRKLLLTGGGRCNITNNKPIKKLLDSFDDKNFLKHSFYTLTNEKLLDLFRKKGLDFVEEDDNRVFPESEKARDVLKILKEYLEDVDIIYDFDVYDISKEGDYFVINDYIKASKVIVATGGITYQETGSSGAGFKILDTERTNLKYGLVPLIANYNFEEFAGINLYGVSVSYKDKSYLGDVLITHKGLTGPAILNISNEISKDLDYDLLENFNVKLDDVKIAIDLMPNVNKEELLSKITKDFQAKGKSLLKNYLKYHLTNSFIPFFMDQAGVDGEVKLGNVLKEDKQKLVNALKGLELEIIGFNSALSKITVGGIKTSAIDSKSMESIECEGLYYAGEILEPVGISGGYNLKIAFSTGYLAGLSASKAL